VSHACPIAGCERPAKDYQLMCWPHWRRVPRALNKAIFETYRNGPVTEYRANVAEAVRIVNEKEVTL
jgi:hypothetical protein